MKTRIASVGNSVGSSSLLASKMYHMVESTSSVFMLGYMETTSEVNSLAPVGKGSSIFSYSISGWSLNGKLVSGVLYPAIGIPPRWRIYLALYFYCQ